MLRKIGKYYLTDGVFFYQTNIQNVTVLITFASK